MYDTFDKLLKEKGLKVIDVSKATKSPQSTFTDWKKGKIKSMKAENIKLIADYLEVSMDYLMTGEESPYVHVDFHPSVEIPNEQKDRLEHYIRAFKTLKEEDQEIVKNVIERLSDGYKEEC